MLYMVLKPLPLKLIERLKQQRYRRFISKNLGAMPSVDPRIRGYPEKEKRDTRFSGQRVRQMRISRHFPDTELVIKRFHKGKAYGRLDLIPKNAQECIDIVNNEVERCNKKFSHLGIEIRKPYAYAISDDLIAMAKTDAPTFFELYCLETPKARSMSRELISKHGIDHEKIRNITLEAETFLRFAVEGAEKGTLILVPFVDLV